ncbi:MAG TPA: tetratricopeptide repeat protein [Bryobacteraceae bacterium]|jgi:tetratricopeptide (TPR) repeat protein
MPLLLFVALLAQSLLAQSADFEAAGKKAIEARNYPEAVAAFRHAVAADPKDYAAHFNLGFAYTMAGQDAEAAQEFKTVLDLHPGVFEAQLNLGVALLRLNRSAEAETAYRAALSIRVDSAAAEQGLGHALALQNKCAEAEPHYRKAAALDPAYMNSLLELAALYEANHQTAEAIAIFREFPNEPAAAEHMGALLLQSSHSAEAIPPLEFAVAKSPTPANRLALAQAYVKEKQLAKAEPLAAAALAQAPDDDAVRMFYGRILRDQRKFKEAAAQFQAVAQRRPDSVEAWQELAGVYLVSDNPQPALAAFDRVRALGAETPSDLFFRAVAHDHLHQSKDALDDYNKFLSASKGTFPEQELQARMRVQALEKDLGKR